MKIPMKYHQKMSWNQQKGDLLISFVDAQYPRAGRNTQLIRPVMGSWLYVKCPTLRVECTCFCHTDGLLLHGLVNGYSVHLLDRVELVDAAQATVCHNLVIFENMNKLPFIDVTGGMFKSNGTTRVPKSVPCLVLDKVRLLFPSEMFCSSQTYSFNKLTWNTQHCIPCVLFGIIKPGLRT